MGLALRQAFMTLGNTANNPAVGCVITKNNSLISAGHTSLNGRPHAEQNAINNSKENLIKSYMYVTLEPCSHYGKTHPCSKLIAKNKIKKVFFSIKDPDIRSYDKCAKSLRKKGIKVNIGINSSKITDFYKSYIKSKNNSLPFLTSKIAISKDYFTINKNKKWITNKYSRGRAHLLRSYHDCIMTSAQTVINDNPLLTCRIDGLAERSPSRIILDSKMRTPVKSKIFTDTKKYSTIIFYNKVDKKKIKMFKKMKIKNYKVDIDSDGNLDLKQVLLKAKKLGFSRIFLEAGIKITTSFLKRDLIDDFKIFKSNNNLGKNGIGNIRKYIKLLRKRKKIIEKVNLLGDTLISYKKNV